MTKKEKISFDLLFPEWKIIKKEIFKGINYNGKTCYTIRTIHPYTRIALLRKVLFDGFEWHELFKDCSKQISHFYN